jgi:hypothetical protein
VSKCNPLELLSSKQGGLVLRFHAWVEPRGKTFNKAIMSALLVGETDLRRKPFMSLEPD